ncbi:MULTISPECIES: hypothetical protein [unclassified Janthinobacterium]|uniref:hypothetical protein n=1 Tax=unclassified Janthinobacterium TaxID=2610881 RepID=UPI00034AB915|nr:MULTISPECIES: hypothetical protein [unclassified Janthinobacterium]MEC5164095.1 hypothetical protein [Janthinobacterium sp. CG_S6]
MVKRKKFWLLLTAVSAATSYMAYSVWHRGSPYGEKKYSPNKAFYYQQYKVMNVEESLLRLSASGQDADARHATRGYVRAYTADGGFVGESSVAGMPMAQLFWSRDKLVIMDGQTSEDPEGIIVLPDNAEIPR